MRGGLHIGVYKAFRETFGSMKFPDGIYGCSVGCIPALAAAYDIPSEDVEKLYSEYFSIDAMFDKVTLDNVSEFIERKGLVTTAQATKTLTDAFLSVGIDLRGKMMKDAPQKLFFLTSNLTTGRACFLTGDIPILQAFACSICVPFVFVPEVVKGHVHVDGAVYTRCIREVVSSETFVAHITRTDVNVSPDNSNLFDILLSMMRGPRHLYHGENVLCIEHHDVRFLDSVTPEQKQTLVEDGYSQTRAFLAKRLAKKVE